MPVKSSDVTPETLLENNGAEYVTSLEKNPSMWADIPLLNYTNVQELKDMSVVRFRGMVQDMMDPEMYLERYEVVRADGSTRMQEGKHRDCYVLNEGERVNHESKDNVQSERRTLFVVSIPGLNNWSKEYEEQCNCKNVKSTTTTPTTPSGKKRPASTDEKMDVDESATSSDASKRPCTEGDQAERAAPTTDNGNSAAATTKDIKKKIEVIDADYHLNSPIRERPGKACMVKIYSGFDDYPLNTVVDVLGFLSIDPSLDMFNMDLDKYEEYDDFEEMQVQNPPPHIIPRLHAIVVSRLPHLNPLMDERLLPVQKTPSLEEINMAEVHQELHQLLTRCLFNDEIAADYLLSHLISTVYNRTDTETVGQFALNLYNLPVTEFPEYTKKLYDILELLLPASHYLPLKLKTINTAPFIPKKDYNTDKLVSGMLQLAPHTHLVLDEMYMGTGALSQDGCKFMKVIADLMQHQKLKCDFKYYEIDYNVDIPVLTLGDQRSNMPHNVWVPVELKDGAVKSIIDTFNEIHASLDPSRLNRFRRYLTMAKTRSFTLSSEESEMVQKDFVEMRKEEKIKSVREFHVLLVLSRLLAIARGKDTLDELWSMAKSMQAKCQERYKELPHYKKRLFFI